MKSAVQVILWIMVILYYMFWYLGNKYENEQPQKQPQLHNEVRAETYSYYLLQQCLKEKTAN